MFQSSLKKKALGALSEQAQLVEIQRRTEMLIRTRDRSEHELKDRLKRAGFSDAVAEKEVARAVLAGLVDNERFVCLYVSGKKRSGWGQLRIEVELRHFGIDIRSQDGYPDKFFAEDEELQRALSCLASLKTSAKDKYAAAYKKLAAKGYSTEVIHQAINLYRLKAPAEI